MNAPEFGTDGIRGVANENLTVDVVYSLGRAGAEALVGFGVEPLLVVGRDTRRSGHMLEAALAAGAMSAGADVEILGVVPTPAVAWATAKRRCPGAMISASHNPFGDNGVKFFAPGGLKLTDRIEEQLQQRYLDVLASTMVTGPVLGQVGTVRSNTGVQGWYDHLVASAEAQLSMKLVIDSAHGAAFRFGPAIFRDLGAEVVEIGSAPDGTNINSGYGSTSPQRLQAAVKEHNADAGICFDGDADRMIAVGADGALVDGDRVLAILASDLKAQGRLVDDTVVATVMANLGFHRAMAEAGIRVKTTNVGDRHVVAALQEGGYSLGGEQSGHIICSELSTTGDGILSAIQLLDAVRRSGRPLNDLAASAMASVPQVMQNVKVTGAAADLSERLQPLVDRYQSKFDSEGRILIRPSGTEPVVRIMVEHLDSTTANDVCNKLVIEAEHLR